MPLILICSIAIVAIIAYLLSIEGIWTAASTLLCVVISGLIAMNFFEPLALYLSYFVPAIAPYADFVALVGLFGGLVFGLRELTEYLCPTDIRVPDLLDTIGKYGFAAATGYVTMAFLLTALHTAPLPREIFDFRAETPAFFGLSPDRQWLGFTQYVSEKSLSNRIVSVPGTSGKQPNIFDGQVRKIGDSPNTIWSSFPMRYAMRREMIAQGQSVAGGGAPPTPAPPPPPRGAAPTPGGF